MAFGKYILFMPIQSSKCASMLEAIVGAINPWLNKRCWSHVNFKVGRFPMVNVLVVVVSLWPCLWWKMLRVVKFLHARLLVVAHPHAYFLKLDIQVVGARVAPSPSRLALAITSTSNTVKKQISYTRFKHI